MERQPHCSPQQPTQACLTPASVSPLSLLPLTCLPFQYVILDVDVAVKGLILFGVWWHVKLTTQIGLNVLSWKSYQKVLSSLAISGIVNMPTGISYKWEAYPAFPRLSVIVLYIVRDSTPMLYVWLYCSLTLFLYIFACLIYIFGLVFTFRVASCSISELAFCSQIFPIYIIPWNSWPKIVFTEDNDKH